MTKEGLSSFARSTAHDILWGFTLLWYIVTAERYTLKLNTHYLQTRIAWIFISYLPRCSFIENPIYTTYR